MAPVSSITGIGYAVIRKVHIRSGTFANHFITAIQIIPTATGRQIVREHPVGSAQINELASGNIIVTFNIREVIIVYGSITRRSPHGLGTDIYTNAYLCF
jgi:hypothetical protein